MLQLNHLIDGAWEPGSGACRESRNPARPDEVVGWHHACDLADVDRAVRAARQAAQQWAMRPGMQRAAVLMDAATLLDRDADLLGKELTREEGKTLREGVGEVRRAAQILRFHASMAQAPEGELFGSPRSSERIAALRRPVGVVTAITPWNFPIAIPAWKIAPALAYGNSVVWKPASAVPVLAFRFAEALHDAGLPAGVLSLLLGAAEVGNAAALHPDVDAVTFTGSSEVGRRLIVGCAQAETPIQAELGGKNAAIVWRDADLDQAAEAVITGAMGSTGQKCTATARVVVDNAVADHFAAQLTARIKELRVGDPLDDVDLGPAVTATASDDIYTAIDAAQKEGCEVLVGGERFDDELRRTGWFVPPTLLTCQNTASATWRSEIFGPVLALMRVEDWEDALAAANAGPYGLSGSVFTSDLSRVEDAIARFDVGVLHVNSETTGAEPHVPFGGTKQSGWGPKEQGLAAREFFTTTKTVYQYPTGNPAR